MSELVHYFESCIIFSGVTSWDLSNFCDELDLQNCELSYNFHELLTVETVTSFTSCSKCKLFQISHCGIF